MTRPDPNIRESFFAAQARHRRSARAWAALAATVVIVLASTISLLLAPLAWAAIGLAADLAHMATPTPDVLGTALAAINHASGSIEGPRPPGVPGTAALLVLAAAPGAILLVLAWWMLRRLSDAHGATLVRDQLGLRAPRADDLEDVQLGNLVEEMALAAGMPAPSVALIDSPACNVAVFGERGDATLVVTRGVLDALGRAPTQALVGQALAALANGDGTLAVRMLRLIEMCGLLMLLAQAPFNGQARAALAPLLPWRRDDGMATLRHALGDPFSVGTPKPASNTSTTLTWREWLLMPLMGSVMIGVVLVPVGVLFVLAPLLGFIWRRRRLLADAAAVQFTRDPQALAEAYAALAAHDTTLPIKAPWLVNLFSLDVIAGASTLRIASPYPSLRTRIERLNALGARVEPPVVTRMNPVWWLLIVPLAALMFVLVGMLMVLGTFVSVALNMLFLGLPVGALHVLLRQIVGG